MLILYACLSIGDDDGTNTGAFGQEAIARLTSSLGETAVLNTCFQIIPLMLADGSNYNKRYAGTSYTLLYMTLNHLITYFYSCMQLWMQLACFLRLALRECSPNSAESSLV
jgi:hypothetical protein